jgi:hypothetical protein
MFMSARIPDPVIKRLFLHAPNRCAFPDCRQPLINAEGIVIANMCHISGERPDAARYDANQTDAQRNGYENIILLCANHHKVVDSDARYHSVSRLLDWKCSHVKEAGNNGTILTARQVARLASGVLEISGGSIGNIITSVSQTGGQNAHSITNNFVTAYQEGQKNLYRHELGSRLKNLRGIFSANKRQMADFFGIKQVSILESYELGDEEMPREMVDKLNTDLHVSRRYLDEGYEFIFDRFDLCGEGVGRFLDADYELMILSRAEPDSWMHIYFALKRSDPNVPSFITTYVASSFHSTGGGWMNINCVIKEMQRRNLDPYIPCYPLDNEEWDRLINSNFYSRQLATDGRLVDHEVCDQFIQRYEEAKLDGKRGRA